MKSAGEYIVEKYRKLNKSRNVNFESGFRQGVIWSLEKLNEYEADQQKAKKSAGEYVDEMAICLGEAFDAACTIPMRNNGADNYENENCKRHFVRKMTRAFYLFQKAREIGLKGEAL